MLFIIFINDIQFATNPDKIRLFADDTGVFLADKNLDNLINESKQTHNYRHFHKRTKRTLGGRGSILAIVKCTLFRKLKMSTKNLALFVKQKAISIVFDERII